MAKESTGMTISLPGVLERAADVCKRSRDNKHLEWPLRKLLEHLQEVDRRAGDRATAISDFFDIWDTGVDDD